MKANYDVIVVGGGPNGLATAYQLSKRKARTLVLEQLTFLNQSGSSAGVSRQFRLPYPQPYMVKFVLDAIPWWDELQLLTSRPLMEKVGTLWFGDPAVKSTEGNIKAAELALEAEGVSYTKLTAGQIEREYRFRNLPETYVGLFQQDGASIDLKATQETLLTWNRTSPYVTLLEQTPVSGIRDSGGRFEVTTPQGRFTAEKLAIVAGPFVDSVVNFLGFYVGATYWNMASAFYRKMQPDIQYPTWFVFQNPVGQNGNQFYGFPEVSWNYPGYIRVASDFVIEPLTTPGQRTFVPNREELAFTAQWVRDHMTGLEPVPEFTSTCLVALSTIPNKELIIDFAPASVPRHKDIVLYATGWSGKFVPLMGRILSDLALDRTTPYNISHFQTGQKYFKRIGE
jgi:glycine/D-amino acid oxidase-like deaminating enzyme